ncbi:MAG TPA: type II toxin-antitoxin system VapC family toxin [Candidatus Limnocylindria bacterium]|nr:type II toxin-antitoxin system VapC family toxin [Candidatus Limnocylindria bacterium]
MIFLPDTNVCIATLRQRHAGLLAKWQSVKANEVVLCSVVVYELRFGAERSTDPLREHSKVDRFLRPFVSLPFSDECARICARMRRDLERKGTVIGPYDLQIASVAIRHDLTLVTHNSREFERISGLRLVDWEA